MKTFFKSLCLCVAVGLASQAAAQRNVAYQDDNARISLVTDGVARLEYSPQGRFVDDSSFVAVNRNYRLVAFKVKKSGRQVTVSTTRMTIRYTAGTGRFTDRNLTITSARNAAVPFRWHPGMKDDQNLLGTYRTLDGYDGNLRHGKPMPIENGLLSRNGWTVVDDSESYLFDHSEWPWLAKRPDGDAQDLYFMAYGHDYKKALKDFTAFAGQVPLPPRYAFGYWWSRYWSYSDHELRQLVDRFHTYNIPLDVLVIDMDWHYTEPGKGGWTGYTFNRRLFPAPDKFLRWLKNEQLQITFNLHPADGIKHFEENYPAMARWMGIDPATKQDIPWQASSKQFMTGWLNTQLRPMEKMGVDFWWLDWQQWNNDKEFPRLSNTWWINYAVFSDMQRHRDTRPMLYHRWGGLGNHRYQIGFSGDAIISWKSLDFQPYYNSTASNVLYGFWSHDIGGHMGADSIDPEMYVRWMQFGALSPILRSHSTKTAGLKKEPWVFDNAHFEILRDIIRQRYEMAPYIYTMARKTHDDAISLCRPMYYDYPEAPEAYTNKSEYMFGDQMLVQPITSPMTDGVSVQRVWLPEGTDWYEVSTGTLLRGGQTVSRRFRLDEYPLYVKAGSIIPLYENARNLRGNDTPLVLAVYPGTQGQFILYEDNGNDKQYESRNARTPLSCQRQGDRLTVDIGARHGTYERMPVSRALKVKVMASAVPTKVTVDGQPARYSYDGSRLALTIDLGNIDCAQRHVVEITYPADAADVADGLLARMRHATQAMEWLKYQDAGIVLNEGLGTMGSLGEALTYRPTQFNQLVNDFNTNFNRLTELLKENKIREATANEFIKRMR
ncbi:DUF5110 domain-containing protein [Prevotella sp. A2931]|uniref:DUF5110 domain-containing protein n=1 Tax=Prevotella illustrans TaxID=2800387 RepID=A0ABS3M659_9BACT|nr:MULTISPECIES: glycoside hydrolase family 31 protein [Prevotella]MBO1363662.1 DUF5110 domain-containing protein [Prevotella illustrans]PTL26804.1 alpha-xylosidase [Prevotella sp. oral taxon 820]